MSSTQQLLLGEGAGGGPANYIEDVFSTYLYTGTGASQTITNGIDLSTKGGLVWTKGRDYAFNHWWIDTVRGNTQVIKSNTSDGNQSLGGGGGAITSFNTTGYGVNLYDENNSPAKTFVSWTFREQAKFFDIVTYTGNGTAGRTVAHNLGSAPGCIIVKRTDDADGWAVYHRSLGATKYIFLDQSNASGTYIGYWNNTEPTSSVFSLGNDAAVNASGATYVAYLFAHDAGGFGLTGTDNVISCGSGTSNASGVIDPVTLGYEPQFVIAKATGTTSHWFMLDTMRGDSLTSISYLRANTSDAETTTTTTYLYPTATGFAGVGNFFGANQPFIYIAIRRGPMAVPTSGTSVFSPIAVTNSAGSNNTTNFPVDLQINSLRSAGDHLAVDRLRGVSSTATNIGSQLITNSSAAEAGSGAGSITRNWGNTGFQTSDEYGSLSTIYWNFRRAPSFFDEVCYTGTGSATTFSHNLGVVPELMIVKRRSSAEDWLTYSSATGNTKYLYINGTATAQVDSRMWNDTTPTSSVFTVGTYGGVNSSGGTFVAYLFATCAGVSKVGSYTGTGTTLQINCGFTAGSRFVMIKRSDSTGDWYVWDSARGIIAGNDPYLLFNSTAAEVTNTDYVDTYNAGFEISSTAPAAINGSGGTFIFLAVA